MWKEFRDFIARGSVIDLAVAVIIGAAFGNIVQSLVNDIIMPPIGLLLGRVDFSNLYVNLSTTSYESLAAAQEAGAPTINYGIFINHVISFLIVRQLNRVYAKPEEPEAPTTKTCPVCFTEIPIQAKRCPNCTSYLEAGAEAEGSAA
jgi:large conductance mechanosensitive channel